MPILDALRSLRAATRHEHPMLSVVIPAYNIDGYLDATLANVAAQSFANFEVIVVDDGSTDGTAAIVERWAERDPRFKLVRQPNAGPSAARNTGVGRAGGPLLTFVDGDDMLPKHAWRNMIRTLERTGSDFVVGRADRWDGESRRWATERMTRNHVTDRLKQRIGDFPEILADVFPWNKIYRTEFWREHDLQFPEGLFYEDQPVLTEAFLAGTFDVLAESVYDYRVRPESTTTKPKTLADMTDRFITKQMTIKHVLAHGDPRVTQVFFADVLPVDMWEYFRGAVAGDQAYWDLLVRETRSCWNETTVPFEETHVPVQQRLMGWLVVNDRRDDLVRLIELIDQQGMSDLVVDGRFEHPWVAEAPERCNHP